MSTKHQLSLEIMQTNNPSLFRVIDTSVYSDQLDVTCGILNITVPGFNNVYSISTSSNFSYSVTACLLGIQTQDCGTSVQPLTDGLYTVEYSVSPNDKVYVKYNYLRTSEFLTTYYNYLCQLETAACDPQPDVKAQLEELRLIKSFHDAAKAKAEHCDDVPAAMELFNYAKRRLNKFGKTCC